jgi:hypothetical protein
MMGLLSFVRLTNSFSRLSCPRHRRSTKIWQDFGKERHGFLTVFSQPHTILLDGRQIERIVSEDGRQFASIRGDCFRLTASGLPYCHVKEQRSLYLVAVVDFLEAKFTCFEINGLA